ncbi:MAG: hypothetical protein JWN69_408 [Alphaproteobacteria bacterium]|nr:hypothetical protein [Alphaproteobacteria bacterium]
MTAPVEDPADTPIAELFHQLVDDGGNVVRAEINLYKQIARYRLTKARGAIAALVIGGMLFFAALIVLLVMLAVALAFSIGPVGAGFVIAAGTSVIGFLLVRHGIGVIGVLGGDESERAALRKGKQKA